MKSVGTKGAAGRVRFTYCDSVDISWPRFGGLGYPGRGCPVGSGVGSKEEGEEEEELPCLVEPTTKSDWGLEEILLGFSFDFQDDGG